MEEVVREAGMNEVKEPEKEEVKEETKLDENLVE